MCVVYIAIIFLIKEYLEYVFTTAISYLGVGIIIIKI